MNTAYPLTTAGGTLSGPLFLADPIPVAPTALVTRLYIDSVVATSATVSEVEALREEVRQLRETLNATIAWLRDRSATDAG